MSKGKKKNAFQKAITFVAGGLLLIVGITLTLAWWQDVVILFKGCVGVTIALIGLLILYTIKE